MRKNEEFNESKKDQTFEDFEEETIDSFECNLCSDLKRTRKEIEQHLANVHGTSKEGNFLSLILKSKKYSLHW